MKLTIEHLKAGYDNAVIIEDLSLEIPEGKITALIGANGCGKSTLLKTICRIQPRLGGRVLLDGGDVHEANPRELAKYVAILPQNPTAPEGRPCASSCPTGARRTRPRSFPARRQRIGR